MDTTPLPLDGRLSPNAQPASDAAAPAETSGGISGMDRRVLLGLAGVAGVAALAKLAQAGPLEPPAGPVSSTGNTLSEINAKTSEAQLTLNAIDRKTARTTQGCAEPRIPITACPPSADAQFVISQPGAYYLPGNMQQQPGLACIDIQCSDVDIDGQGFSFVGTSNASSPPSAAVRASGQQNIELYDCAFVGWLGDCCALDTCDHCALSDISFRTCTCPPGYHLVRCGKDACIEDAMVSSCTGGLLCGETSHLRAMQVHGGACPLSCGNGCCVDDSSFSSCSAGTDAAGNAIALITCGTDCSVSECHFRKCSCPLGSFSSRCVVECCEVSTCVGDAFAFGEACCMEDCVVLQHVGRVCTCPDGCCITECDFRRCTCPTGALVTVGSDCVVECCEITGGSSQTCAIQCADRCSVEDCSIMSHQGAAIVCGSSCCVCECRCMEGFAGISCASDCVIEDNDISVAASNGTVGGGPAVAVQGARGSVICNYVRRGGIIIFGGSSACVIEENTVLGGDGPPGTDGGSISIAQGVTGCCVRSNTVHRASMSNAFVIPPGNTFGPVVNAIPGGDLSTLQGGSHPTCNCVHL